jgi:hypothetical protein
MLDFATACQFMDDNKPEIPEEEETFITEDTMQQQYQTFRSSPVLYNMDGYISPYASNNWNNTSSILMTLTDESRLPPLDNKIDPNKIFSPDLIALKSLAADQQKIVKLFERRLMDSLKDKNKMSLTEEDVLAMQALTAARNLVSNIKKEEANIKKTSAEIRIKQQQAQNNINKMNGTVGGEMAPTPTSTMGLGRSMLDAIFDASGIQVDTNPANIPNADSIQAVDLDSASRLLDDITNVDVDDHIKYEHLNPTTYVLVGDTDDDIEFATYAENGSLITDYPNPTTSITELDREARTAQDSVMNRYPVKFKNEM